MALIKPDKPKVDAGAVEGAMAPTSMTPLTDFAKQHSTGAPLPPKMEEPDMNPGMPQSAKPVVKPTQEEVKRVVPKTQAQTKTKPGAGLESDRYKKNKISDMAFEIGINNMLFQPHTPFINTTSNAVTSVMSLQDTFWRTFTSAFNPPEAKTYAREFVAEANGWAHGIIQGMKYTSDRLRSYLPGQQASPAETLEKLNLPTGLESTNRLELNKRTISSEGLGLNEDTIQGKVADTMGSFINLPGSVLNNTDMMFKIQQAERMKFGWAAHKVADGTYADMDTAFKNLQNDPDMHRQIVNGAEYYTFMSRPQSPAFSWITETAMEKLPGMRWVVPFKRSIANIAEQTIERSPLVLAMPTLAGRLVSKDPAIRATAQARLLTGISTMSVLGYALNDHLVGSAPQDMKTRDVWERVNGRENTLQFKNSPLGDVALELDTMGVYGQYLKMIAGYKQWAANYGQKMYNPNNPEMLQEFGQFLGPTVNVLYDSYWGKNITEFSGVVTKAIEQNDPTQLVRWLSRMGVRTIPLVGSGMARQIVQADQPYRKDHQDLIDLFRERSLEANQNIRNQYSWDGDLILYSKFRGAGDPMFNHNPYNFEKDKMEQGFLEWGVTFSEPNDYYQTPPIDTGLSGVSNPPGPRIDYNPEEWQSFNEWHKNGVFVKGVYVQPIREAIHKNLLTKSGFRGLHPERKAQAVQEFISKYRRVMHSAMLEKFPDLKARVIKAYKARGLEVQEMDRAAWRQSIGVTQ